MRLSQTMGVELPRAGSGVFQRIFSEGLQRSGRLRSLHTPVPAGPRQAGQLSPQAASRDVKKASMRIEPEPMQERGAMG
jgi:hypothetical protein